MSMRQFWQARKTAVLAEIEAYEAASLAFATNGALQEYKIDTGQTNQTVKRADLGKIQEVLDGLYNRYTVICSRLDGGSVSVGVPGF